MRFAREKNTSDVRSTKPDACRLEAYVDALKMLGRRELSERQVRQRLARHDYEATAIDEAIARLKEERAIDDERAAGAIARSATSIKRRGRIRVKRDIENAGIASSTATKALDQTFADVDEDALIAATLSRRLRGREGPLDRSALTRLYRYLRTQGFDHDRIMRHLDRGTRGRRLEPED